MNEIVVKEVLAEHIKLMVFKAPRIAAKAQPGQFIILRVNETGERFPLTIADFDRDAGTLSIVFLELGRSTTLLGELKVGDAILDVVGPLGHATEIVRYGSVVCVGGGVGIPAIHPVARAFKNAGNRVTSIIGAKTRSLLFWEEQMRRVSDELIVTTDDGSYGAKGFVTDRLQELIDAGRPIDLVFAVGPTVMMRAVANLTRPHALKTLVSLNPIMVDGTGMCGGCRVEVGGERKFVCVDGPDFDAHQVNFELLMSRQRTYIEEEQLALGRCARHAHG